jgi:hypothetical protein
MSIIEGILLQKSFWGGGGKFLQPLMRFTRGDVRDHIVSSKIDHGPPQGCSIFDFCNNIEADLTVARGEEGGLTLDFS